MNPHSTQQTPPLLDDAAKLDWGLRKLATGTGPIAIDTERAGSFRYDDRAFLIQLNRAGVGTLLLDPEENNDAIEEYAAVVNNVPWVLHAGHSDLPALVNQGWHPRRINDTQIAGRLLGLPHLNLEDMTSEQVGVDLPTDKSVANWSRRPIPEGMLKYAAGDVDHLLELGYVLQKKLADLGRLEWYNQECQYVRKSWAHDLQHPEWHRMKGLSRVTSRRSLAIIKALWMARNEHCASHDLPASLVFKDAAIFDVAQHPKAAAHKLHRYIARGYRLFGEKKHRQLPENMQDGLRAALKDALKLPSAELPKMAAGARHHGKPRGQDWPEDKQRAEVFYESLRRVLTEVAAELEISGDTIAVQRQLRNTACGLVDAQIFSAAAQQLQGDSPDPVGFLEQTIGHHLSESGLRQWQIQLLTAPTVASLFS